jgi:ABC-type transport system involved in cytochrome c biogenesis permease subunit
MYEFINLTCFCGLVAGAIVLRRSQYRPLWVFLLLPVLILLTVSGRWLYTNAAPVMPALQSYWLPIHVSVVSLGSGVFLVAGVASILFLLRTSRLGEPDTPGAFAQMVQRLPDAQTLDRIAYRTTIFAFPVFGFGVIFGAIWAEQAWAATGAGIPRRRWRSSPGWFTPPTCMPGRRRGGGTERLPGSTWSVSWRWCSTCSSSTW